MLGRGQGRGRIGPGRASLLRPMHHRPRMDGDRRQRTDVARGGRRSVAVKIMKCRSGCRAADPAGTRANGPRLAPAHANLRPAAQRSRQSESVRTQVRTLEPPLASSLPRFFCRQASWQRRNQAPRENRGMEFRNLRADPRKEKYFSGRARLSARASAIKMQAPASLQQTQIQSISRGSSIHQADRRALHP